MRTCGDCKQIKPLLDFHKNKTKSLGHEYICKLCKNKRVKLFYTINQEKRKTYSNQYYTKNKDSCNKKSSDYYTKNKELIQNNHRQWERDNTIYRKEYRKTYYKKHKGYIREYDKNRRTKKNEYQREYRLNHCIVPTQQWRYTKEYKQWKESVYKLYNHTCQECGKTHCKVHAHHIKSAKDYPDLRYDINNGICLCEQCHKQVHYNI